MSKKGDWGWGFLKFGHQNKEHKIWTKGGELEFNKAKGTLAPEREWKNYIIRVYPQFLSPEFVSRICLQSFPPEFVPRIHPQSLFAEFFPKVHPQNSSSEFMPRVYAQSLSPINYYEAFIIEPGDLFQNCLSSVTQEPLNTWTGRL